MSVHKRYFNDDTSLKAEYDFNEKIHKAHASFTLPIPSHNKSRKVAMIM